MVTKTNETKTTSREVQLRTSEGLLQVANNFIDKTKGLSIPADYDVNSAVTSLFFALKESGALTKATPDSIQNTVQEYISRGLNTSKKQAYPIMYGNEVKLHIGAFGNTALARREAGVKIITDTIRDGDSVEIISKPDGSKEIKHKTSWKNQQNEITGAFAVATDIRTGEVIDSEIMTMKDIEISWSQSTSRQMSVHKKFPNEMARKTVASRLAKHLVNSTDDSLKFSDIQSDAGLEDHLQDIYVDEESDISIKGKKETTENTEIFVDETNEDEQVIIITELEDLSIEDTEISENNIEISDNENEVIEISYAEYKNNKDNYDAVNNSYNATTKTIKVRKK